MENMVTQPETSVQKSEKRSGGSRKKKIVYLCLLFVTVVLQVSFWSQVWLPGTIPEQDVPAGAMFRSDAHQMTVECCDHGALIGTMTAPSGEVLPFSIYSLNTFRRYSYYMVLDVEGYDDFVATGEYYFYKNRMVLEIEADSEELFDEEELKIILYRRERD